MVLLYFSRTSKKVKGARLFHPRGGKRFSEWNFGPEESILGEMAVCEYHKEYTDYLNQRIASELIPDGFSANRTWSQVWSVVQNTAICCSIENISPEEAGLIYNTLFCLYPRFEQAMKEELETQFEGGYSTPRVEV